MALPRSMMIATAVSVGTLMGAVTLFFASGEPVVLAALYFAVPAIWGTLFVARVVSPKMRLLGGLVTFAIIAAAVTAFFAYSEPILLVIGFFLAALTWSSLSIHGLIGRLRETPA